MFNWLWILATLLTIGIPIASHSAQNCGARGWWLCLHSVLHHESYKRTFDLGPSRHWEFEFDRFSLWVLFAFLQVAAISFILAFERDDKTEKTRLPFVVAVLASIFAVVAAAAAGSGLDLPYRVLVLFVLISLVIGDVLMWCEAPTDAASRKERFLAILLGVDLPILCTWFLLNFYVGTSLRDLDGSNRTMTFFTGATAFQLMLANFAIILLTFWTEWKHKPHVSVVDFVRWQLLGESVE